MAARRGLGRGLGTLIPQQAQDRVASAEEAPIVDSDVTYVTPTADPSTALPVSALRDVPVGDIEPNPHQPRAHFDEQMLVELADSIREIGVLQPLLVRSLPDGRYQLIAGERRWRAAQRAGLKFVPVVVREVNELSSVEQALVENLHRQDLTPLEEASAYQQLIEDFDLTHEKVAKRVGKSRSAVTNSLRFLSLPAAVQGYLADGRLTAGHAKALLGTPDRSQQEKLAKSAVEAGWSVRATEDAVRHGQTGPADAGRKGTSSRPGAGLRAPGLLELESLLGEYLSTKVSVTQAGGKRGRITIDFADLEDLERIYRAMTEGGQ